MIKKILVLMAFGSCFGGMFDSVTNAAGTAQCANSCDAGAIIKTLKVDSTQAKTMSTTACQVACTDQCFSGQINNKSSSEIAAMKCQDSLKQTFKLSN